MGNANQREDWKSDVQHVPSRPVFRIRGHGRQANGNRLIVVARLYTFDGKVTEFASEESWV
jgi:hypothetical protein